MVWFEGSIPSAIQKARDSRLLFLVLILDDSDDSSILESFFFEEQLVEFVAQSAVALRLDASSQDAISFSQLYPISKVPALFVVNPLTGALMEVLGMPFEMEAATARLCHHHTILLAIPALQQQQQQEQQQQQPAVQAEQQQQPQKHSMTEEEKKAELKRLREKVAAKMKEKEAEKEHERELKRRREGVEIMQARDNLEELQAKQLVEQRKKEKREEDEARRRIREQIARDREETARERERLKNPTPPTPTQQTTQNDFAALVIRLTDGSVIKNRFKASDTLGVVRDYIDQNRTDGRGPYILVINFPYRNLTDSDMVTSLQDLGFVPSATIILKPATTVSQAYSGTSVTRPVLPQGGQGFSVYGNIIAPLLALIMGLWYTLFPPASQAQRRVVDAETGHSTPPSNPSTSRDASNTAPPQGSRDPKVRQIADLRGDGPTKPEDTRFYNGNSLSFDG